MPKQDEIKPNGWNEYSRLVLNELKRLSTAVETATNQYNALAIQISESHAKLRQEIALLKQHNKTQSIIWGSVGTIGTIFFSGMVALIVNLIRTP